MALFNKTELERRVIYENRILTGDALYKGFSTYDSAIFYDVFLSHSYKDKNAVIGLADELKNKYGLKVYIDWVEDKELDRSMIDENTAKALKERMMNCKCLLYATSENAVNSKWMPWEAGLMDGLKGRVTICPLMGGADSNFKGQEYLAVYPYISIDKIKGANKEVLWVNKGDKYVLFDKWLSGKNP